MTVSGAIITAKHRRRGVRDKHRRRKPHASAKPRMHRRRKPHASTFVDEYCSASRQAVMATTFALRTLTLETQTRGKGRLHVHTCIWIIPGRDHVNDTLSPVKCPRARALRF